MTKDMIVRAWKDPDYRSNLTPEERSMLPDHPASVPMTELDEESVNDIIGGAAAVSCVCSCGWVCTLTTECGCSYESQRPRL